MDTVVITGANRGLGLELAKVFAVRGATVIGGCRTPGAADELRAVTEHIYPVDTGDERSIADFVTAVGDGPVDVLVNNAGLSAEGLGAGPGRARCPAADRPSTSWADRITPSADASRPRAGTGVAPLRSARSSTSRRRSARWSSAHPHPYATSATVHEGGAQHGHHQLASRLHDDGVVAVAVHPGWLRTAMGGASADLDPTEAAVQIVT